MAVSKRLRYEILRRDSYRCRYCGVGADEARLTVDHVVPVTLGGGDESSNLCAACGPCNSRKSSSAPDAPLVDDVAGDALRWAAAMRQAAAIQAANVESRAAYVAAFDAAWCHWTYADDRTVSRPPDWASYVGRTARPRPRGEGTRGARRRCAAAANPRRSHVALLQRRGAQRDGGARPDRDGPAPERVARQRAHEPLRPESTARSGTTSRSRR